MTLSCYYDSDDSEDYDSYVSPSPRYSNIHSSCGTYNSHRSSYVSSTAYPFYESRRVSSQAYDSYSPSSATYSSYGSRRVSSLAYDSHSPSPTTYSYESRRVSPQAYDSYSPSSTTYPSVRHSSNSYDLPSPSPKERYLVELERKKQAREEEREKKQEEWRKSKARFDTFYDTTMEQLKKNAAVSLQTHIRGVLQRRSLEQKKQAVCIIQTRVRGYLQRQSFRRMQRSVVVIQRHVRSWILWRRAVLCPLQWTYYNPLFSVDGISGYDDEDWEEVSVVEELIEAGQMRVATPTDLLQRLGQSLLVTTVSDMPIYAMEVPVTCLMPYTVRGLQVDEFDWDPGDTEMRTDTLFFTPHIEMVIVSADPESAAPSLYFTVVARVLMLRPSPKPPDDRIVACHAELLAHEASSRSLMTVERRRIRPSAKPPWSKI